MNETLEITILSVPPILMYAGWFILRGNVHGKQILCLIWIMFTIVLAIFGFTQWNIQTESTRLYATIAPTSTLWFLAPLLIFTVGKHFHAIWAAISTLTVPVLSFFICFFLMGIAGQWWGM